MPHEEILDRTDHRSFPHALFASGQDQFLATWQILDTPLEI